MKSRIIKGGTTTSYRGLYRTEAGMYRKRPPRAKVLAKLLAKKKKPLLELADFESHDQWFSRGK